MEDEMSKPETIACAAIVHKGQVFAMPRPARHHTIMHAIAKMVPESDWPIASGFRDQGFLTSAGRYVIREEAYEIALAAGQFTLEGRAVNVPGKLFSEDLW
jgi:hypothetical protein